MGGILFLVHRAPWPPDRGDRIRSWHMLQALRSIGPVHLAAVADNDADAAAAREVIAPLCASTMIVPRTIGRGRAAVQALATGQPLSLPLFASAALAAHVDRLLSGGKIDRIVAFSSQMAQFVPAGQRFVMDFCDADSAKFADYGATLGPWSPMGRIYAREGRLLARWEQAVAARADASTLISDAERAIFLDRCRADPAKLHVVGNGIDTARFAPDGDFAPLSPKERGAGPMAVFTGQMDYPPNIAAVDDFARGSLPLLRDRYPNARFAIVGRAPTPAVRALGALPGVVVTGEVPDTRPWLAAADVVVAPLAIARGVQNKLLEAMAMARAVVASPAAAQGITVEQSRDLLVADGSVATADAVAALFDAPDRATAMGAAARARMIERYSWAAAMAPLLRLVAA